MLILSLVNCTRTDVVLVTTRAIVVVVSSWVENVARTCYLITLFIGELSLTLLDVHHLNLTVRTLGHTNRWCQKKTTIKIPRISIHTWSILINTRTLDMICSSQNLGMELNSLRIGCSLLRHILISTEIKIYYFSFRAKKIQIFSRFESNSGQILTLLTLKVNIWNDFKINI